MDVSIIFVNWKSADFLRECLATLYANTFGIKVECIVVDNASFDGCGQMLSSEFPQVRFIQSRENLGFSRANNLGVEASSGRILLFLNPDTVILGNAIADMADSLMSLADAGVVGCRVLNADRTVQMSAVQPFPTILRLAVDSDALRLHFPHWNLWGMQPLFSECMTATAVDTVTGACLMIRRDVFERVGRFSPEYFMYGEDTDLCRKVWIAGLKVYHLPTTSIIHYGGQSTQRKPESTFTALLQHVSMDIYFSKFHGSLYAGMFRVSRVLAAIVRLALLRMMQLRLSDKETRVYHWATIAKWATTLRWALGLENWDGPEPSSPPSSADAAKCESPES